jgi:hypothetical protein
MIKVFDYITELDCFKVNKEFSEINNDLGLCECSDVVWIGRYFSLDNDFGEHWFDNWDERDAAEEKASALGYKYEDLLFIKPERFQNGEDGPCHTDEQRKMLWTDVCKSLHLSIETIIEEARKNNDKSKNSEDYIEDLEERIARILRNKNL